MLSEVECRELAEKFSKAADSQDASALAALFDWDVLLHTATSQIQAPDAVRQHFAAEMKGDGKKAGELPREIFDLVARGATYRFLHSRVADNQQRLLFRLAVPDFQGLNYHDVVLSRRPDGQIRATDIYIFINGEMLSQTTRRAFLTAVLRLAQAPAARLHGVRAFESRVRGQTARTVARIHAEGSR